MCSAASCIQVPFQGRPHPRARPVEEYPLIAVRYVQCGTHLLSAAAGDVAHGDDDALGIRQRLDRAREDRERLALEQRLLRYAAPVLRERAPVAGKRLPGRGE